MAGLSSWFKVQDTCKLKTKGGIATVSQCGSSRIIYFICGKFLRGVDLWHRGLCFCQHHLSLSFDGDMIRTNNIFIYIKGIITHCETILSSKYMKLFLWAVSKTLFLGVSKRFFFLQVSNMLMWWKERGNNYVSKMQHRQTCCLLTYPIILSKEREWKQLGMDALAWRSHPEQQPPQPVSCVVLETNPNVKK